MILYTIEYYPEKKTACLVNRRLPNLKFLLGTNFESAEEAVQKTHELCLWTKKLD